MLFGGTFQEFVCYFKIVNILFLYLIELQIKQKIKQNELLKDCLLQLHSSNKYYHIKIKQIIMN